MTNSMQLRTANRRCLFYLLVAAVLPATGCGGGSTFNVQNPPPQSQQHLTIAFQPAPATGMSVGATVPLTAVVSNDTSKSGVDWNVTCQDGNCGSVSPEHTGSGQPTTYTPPLKFAGNNQNVNIIAYATADHTQNTVAPLAITAFGNNLKGTYILQAQGLDSTFGQTYQVAGAVVLDGNGGVTGGEQTVNLVDPIVGSLLSKSDPISGGSYFLGADGRGEIILNTGDTSVGANGTETFTLVFLSSSQGLIAQEDGTASASGTLDLQTAVATPSGGYAFVVGGTDVASLSQTAFGGVFNIDSANTISGLGSVSDQNLAGTLTQNSTLSGSLSNPDAFGALTIDLTIGFASGPVQFTAYVVDATHMKLIESDNNAGVGFGSTDGLAISQGAATGTFKSLASFSGNYVFGVLGEDLSGGIPSTMTSAGVFTSDGAGNLNSGFTDTLFQANCVQKTCTTGGITGAQISAAFSGHYTMVLNGKGRVRVMPSVFSPSPLPAFHHLLIFYLTGNGTPALVLDGGDLTVAQSYGSVGTGIAYPQSAGPFTFAGKYGFSLTQQNGSETDSTGQWTADPNALTLAGTMDTPAAPNAALTGSFVAPGPDGRFAGNLSGSALAFNGPTMDFYTIDSSHGFFVETDLTNSTSPSATVSLGYYAARTPVCAGCP